MSTPPLEISKNHHFRRHSMTKHRSLIILCGVRYGAALDVVYVDKQRKTTYQNHSQTTMITIKIVFNTKRNHLWSGSHARVIFKSYTPHIHTLQHRKSNIFHFIDMSHIHVHRLNRWFVPFELHGLGNGQPKKEKKNPFFNWFNQQKQKNALLSNGSSLLISI